MCNSILIGDCILYKPDCNEQNYSSVVKQGIEIVMFVWRVWVKHAGDCTIKGEFHTKQQGHC